MADTPKILMSIFYPKASSFQKLDPAQWILWFIPSPHRYGKSSLTSERSNMSHWQGLVTVPFWEYWTSPYSSHGIDQIPNGWVMFNGDISHDPWLIPSSKWHQTSSNRIWSMRISESQLEPTTPPGTTQRSLRAGNPSGKNMKNQLFSQGAPVR